MALVDCSLQFKYWKREEMNNAIEAENRLNAGNSLGLAMNGVNLNSLPGFFEAEAAQLSIDKANGDYRTMVETLCRIKAQIDGVNEYGNEGVARDQMEDEFGKILDNLFGASGGRRGRKHRKSRKSKRKARKTRRR